MKNVAWFVIGWLFSYQAAVLFPGRVQPTTLFSTFILEPLRFLQGAIFILASFIIFSYSIRYAIITLVNLSYEKRRKALVYGMIGCITVLFAWSILFIESTIIATVIVLLSLIHLGLSLEGFKKVTHKGR